MDFQAFLDACAPTGESSQRRFEVTGSLANALASKASARGKKPMDLLATLLNLPDEKLDRALPPGYRLPVEPSSGMRIAAKDADDDENAAGKGSGGGGRRK